MLGNGCCQRDARRHGKDVGQGLQRRVVEHDAVRMRPRIGEPGGRQGAKADTHRVAVAGGRIRMQPTTLAMVRDGNARKGDVLGVARIAVSSSSAPASSVRRPRK